MRGKPASGEWPGWAAEQHRCPVQSSLQRPRCDWLGSGCSRYTRTQVRSACSTVAPAAHTAGLGHSCRRRALTDTVALACGHACQQHHHRCEQDELGAGWPPRQQHEGRATSHPAGAVTPTAGLHGMARRQASLNCSGVCLPWCACGRPHPPLEHSCARAGCAHSCWRCAKALGAVASARSPLHRLQLVARPVINQSDNNSVCPAAVDKHGPSSSSSQRGAAIQ